MMQKIGALIDSDSRLIDVLDTSFKLAERHQAELHIYHYVPKNSTITIDGGNILIGSDQTINETIKALSKDRKVNYKIAFGSGKFRKSVTDFVQENELDLLVIGSNGISNTSERIFGSHAEKVIENVACSVLVLKDVKMEQDLKQVVFASSFNEGDKEVLKHFLDLFDLPEEAIIHLLMVDTYSFFNQPTLVVKESFREFSEIAQPYRTETHFYHGITVEEGINSFMEEVSPDLLVMSNKYSRLLRTAISSGSKMLSTLHENQYPFLNIDYDTTSKKN